MPGAGLRSQSGVGLCSRELLTLPQSFGRAWRRRMCEVASQGKQMKLDELVFDRWQRGGYYREQPKKDTETAEMCD